MASLSISVTLSSPASPATALSGSPCPSSLTSSTSGWSPHAVALMPLSLGTSTRSLLGHIHRRRLQIVRMAPEEEKMTRRSPLDFPIEWERPKPGRRPDIFPQFSPMKTPLPPPLPSDPPEEDEEEEEEKKEEEEENPEEEEGPDKPDQ